MQGTKIYISGPMQGTLPLNTEKFNKAEDRLSAMGFDVKNPSKKAVINEDEHMRNCLIDISKSEMIFMLSGWDQCKMSRLEHHIAGELGMPILYEN